MIDIKLIRENPDFVKENIKKKFQDEKLPLVDEVRDLDEKYRAAKQHGDDLRAERNRVSKQIGALFAADGYFSDGATRLINLKVVPGLGYHIDMTKEGK